MSLEIIRNKISAVQQELLLKLEIKSIAMLEYRAIPHNSKCRYGERGAADAKPKAQIILDAAKVSAASGGNSEPKQGQRSQSAGGFGPRSTMRVPQPDIIEHFGNADAVPQPPERAARRELCGVAIDFLKASLLFDAEHPIADSDVRLYVLLPVFSAFQLFAQGRHEHPQRSNIVFPTAAPNLLCDVGVGQNLAHIF